MPPRAPKLVLLHTSTPALRARIDDIATRLCDAIDLRSGVAWIDVPDARACLEALLTAVVGAEERTSVRVAVAPPAATLDELMQAAMKAPTLTEFALAFERDDLRRNPPQYDVHYQPIVRLDTRTVIGFESLLRATILGEALETEDLIDRAEAGAWLPEFDQLGRNLAVRGVGEWLDDGLLFMNVMAPNGAFDLEAITTTVELAVDAGLAADQLVFEALERNQYTDVTAAAEQIEQMRAMGARIALDDVGEGHADLRLITEFRPDIIKLSGTLVRRLPEATAARVIQALVELAHDTQTWVVAENIETSEQAEALSALGVDWGQGHFLGQPAARPSV